MEGHTRNGQLAWVPCSFRSHSTPYAKLRRYLFSISLAGVVVCYTRDPEHTAYDVVEWYHYFQKPWREHTSLLQMQRVTIPTLNMKPNLTRRWAAALTDVGVELSERAAQHFKKPQWLAIADEEEWLQIDGIGPRTAKSIIKEIKGG